MVVMKEHIVAPQHLTLFSHSCSCLLVTQSGSDLSSTPLMAWAHNPEIQAVTNLPLLLFSFFQASFLLCILDTDGKEFPESAKCILWPIVLSPGCETSTSVQCQVFANAFVCSEDKKNYAKEKGQTQKTLNNFFTAQQGRYFFFLSTCMQNFPHCSVNQELSTVMLLLLSTMMLLMLLLFLLFFFIAFW